MRKKKYKKKEPVKKLCPPKTILNLVNLRLKWKFPLTKEYIENIIVKIKRLLRKNEGGVLRNFVQLKNVPYSPIPIFKYGSLEMQIFLPENKNYKIKQKLNDIFQIEG